MINIITLHDICNPGSVFQAYGLNKFLLDRGYDCEIIDYVPPYSHIGKNKLKGIEKELNKKYGEGTVIVEIKEQYRNMKEKIEPVMHIIDNANEAMIEANVTPNIRPIRGGTDGARLSFMGLPTPNIFAGGENFHGKYEYVPIESMEKAVEVIVNIVKRYSK